MGIFSKIVFASAFSFLALRVHADTLVSCVGKKEQTTTLSYVIKGTESQRLGSDLTYFKNGNGSLISSLNVAQYASTKTRLYIVIDDSAENIKMRFTANSSKNAWSGTIEEISPSGTTKTALKCQMSTL